MPKRIVSKSKASKRSAARSRATRRPPSRSKAAKPASSLTSTSKHAPPPIDPLFAPVAQAFANAADVVRRQMFGNHDVLAVGGKIFAMLNKGRLVVKLPKSRVDAMVEGGLGTRFEPGPRHVMKEWVVVEQGAAPWLPLAREAHGYVKKVGRKG
jgi:hypothetical protein